MEVTAALALCRFARDSAALLLWGSSAFLILAPQPVRASLASPYARSRKVAVLAIFLAVPALLPIQAASLGDGWPDALDPSTIGALLSGTTIGTAWLIQGVAAMALLLVPVLPCPWRVGVTAAVSALLLGSFTLTGHAAMHEGWLGMAHRTNDLLHLLAAGFWFGALLPLWPTLALLSDPVRHSAASVALRRFSAIGHAAVTLVIVTGVLNTALIVEGWPTNWASIYQRLLVAKIMLVAVMTALAVLNRYAFVPQLRDTPPRAIRRIRHATLAEVALGLGALALVAIFGLLDPA